MSEEPRLPKHDSNLEQLDLVVTNDEGEANFDASAVAPSIHASIELTEKNDAADDEGDTGSFLAPLSKTSSSFAGSFVDLGKVQVRVQASMHTPYAQSLHACLSQQTRSPLLPSLQLVPKPVLCLQGWWPSEQEELFIQHGEFRQATFQPCQRLCQGHRLPPPGAKPLISSTRSDARRVR
jgi:hypothetical protein